MPGAVSPAIVSSSNPRRVWFRTLRRITGVVAWHGVLIMACAFVLVPIVMVVLGSFKTVNEFFASPYGLPESFGLHNYQKAFTEANLPAALRNSIVSTGLGVAISTTLAVRLPPVDLDGAVSSAGWPAR
jgi:ABC-type glycerol-3-phosphate transport system permease component